MFRKRIDDHGHFLLGGKQIAYAIQRSKKRRRTIGLTIGREGNIRILAPMRTGFGAIERLVFRQRDWINRHLHDFQQRQSSTTARRFVDGETCLYRGMSYTLRIIQDAARRQGCALEGDLLVVNLPEGGGGEDVRLELLLWYKKEARRIFQQRIDEWSEKLNLRYRRFSVSNPQRLWGSCSGRNEIRVAWRLIMAPPELLDYVIVHELCHIPHKNHSARFWRAVEDAMPGCKALRKQLHAMAAQLTL